MQAVKFTIKQHCPFRKTTSVPQKIQKLSRGQLAPSTGNYWQNTYCQLNTMAMYFCVVQLPDLMHTPLIAYQQVKQLETIVQI